MQSSSIRCLRVCVDCLLAVKKRYDIRFSQRELELQFKASLEHGLRISMIVFCVIAILSYVLMVVSWVQKVDGDVVAMTLDYQAKHPTSTIPWLIVGTLVMYPIVLLMALSSSKHLPIFRFIDMELAAILFPVMICGAMPWTNEWTIAHIFGEDPEDIFGPDAAASEGRVVLVLDGVITVVCLFVPVRIHLKCAPAIVGCVSFAVAVIVVGSPFPSNAARNVFTLTALAMCALWGAFNNELTARQKFIACADSERKSDELMKQHAGTSRILGKLCDSLLQLESDFRILEYDHRFPALLLCASENMRDLNFCDYIASEEDRKRFVLELEGSGQFAELAENATSAAMLHLNLRDNLGRQFKVYAYFTPTYVNSGRCGYMIALVEPEERTADVHQGFATLACPQVNSHAEVAISISDSFSEESAQVRGEVAAWINVTSQCLEILHCSAGFSGLGYLDVGAGLSQWLGNNKSAFVRWLQNCSNMSCYDITTAQVKPFPLHLQTTQNASVEFVASCLPDFQASQPAPFEDCLAIRIVLSDVKCRRVSSRSRRSQNNPRAIKVVL